MAEVNYSGQEAHIAYLFRVELVCSKLCRSKLVQHEDNRFKLLSCPKAHQ